MSPLTSHGYVRVLLPREQWGEREWPYEYEHRLVWETAYGPIPEGYEIHHKNGIKTDNRLENLALLTPEQHTELHRREVLAGRRERFLSRTKRVGDCWLWTGLIQSEGYGLTGTKPQEYAHRYAYELFVQPIALGERIGQSCGNRLCVSAEHLRAERGTRLRSRLTHCRHGHEFTPENTYIRPDTGGRQCLTCRNARNATRPPRGTRGQR